MVELMLPEIFIDASGGTVVTNVDDLLQTMFGAEAG